MILNFVQRLLARRPIFPSLIPCTLAGTALVATLLLLSPVLSSVAGQKSDASNPAITVGSNVEVSTADHSSAHDEVLLGANPTDANQLVACTMVDQNRLSERKMHTAVYTSGDGGKTWNKGPDIPETGDPICAYGPDGAVYFGAIVDTVSEPKKDWYLKMYR